MKGYQNYDKFPAIEIKGYRADVGYKEIVKTLSEAINERRARVVVFDAYPSVDLDEVVKGLRLLGGRWFYSEDCFLDKTDYRKKLAPYLTDDRVFGRMNALTLSDMMLPERVNEMRRAIAAESGPVFVIGVGASLLVKGELLIYLDLARWEIQCRFAEGLSNFHTDNADAPKLLKFKQGYFAEWRMADRHKKRLFNAIDYLLDTNVKEQPKLISGEAFRKGLSILASRPFRMKPYFAPEIWGGQWMKEVCDLDRSAKNFAWAFDGVPEENSVLLRFGEVTVEVPAIDIVFYRPKALLGERVFARFGDEYPIRFDFLDTMGGQNLSLQVHPTEAYIQKTFGMPYTQDESYYILDCEEDSCVYLGLREGVDRDEMLEELEKASRGESLFLTERFVNKIPVKPHDHILIPAGTVHCSGSGTMVLEISATPYIFTFKLWDFARLGLDGLPRPTHIEHGKQVIKWERTTEFVYRELVNHMKPLVTTDACFEEQTGLHESEFIETRRCRIRQKTAFSTEGSVVQANVVSGRGALIESPTDAFAPYEVHYAETFVIPESVKHFTVCPLDGEVTILKATVR